MWKDAAMFIYIQEMPSCGIYIYGNQKSITSRTHKKIIYNGQIKDISNKYGP